jgi:1-aminocyclopropane-1-carboxylate deaminase/D-cysteine desulfhydrase-like pyridoxal-dependent ACC family enzyme
MIPLFKKYRGLEEALPYVGLCDLPTPVRRLETMGRSIGVEQLYIKEDGYTARPFGGNKVRKLEFLLGEAIRQGMTEVMTFGFAGSNHALATAVHAGKLGLKSISMLMPQANAHYVRRNLLMGRMAGAEMRGYPDFKKMSSGARNVRWGRRLTGRKAPYVIPPGGSSSLGVVGFVNAMFELKQQIDNSEMPEPDKIYLPMGTAGTAVGLAIGIKALSMKTKLVPVRIMDPDFISIERIRRLFAETVQKLRANDSMFPRVSFDPEEYLVRDEYIGDGYAVFSEKGMEAVRSAQETENIDLDGTYTGKGFACLMEDGRQGKLKDEVVLYWNTLNARDISNHAKEVDYQGLPKPLHRYFEEDVQPLDR